ncbi:GSCOCG00005640001-RA-CDS [Cotesia congregata]|nr:GSCOCG00005640001-RA-CDS [Cotesia congregata]
MSDFFPLFPIFSLNCSTFAFAAGIAGVGVYNYKKTNSKISLIAGLSYGSVLTCAWYSTVNHPFEIWGIMATTASLAITSAVAAGIVSASRIINDNFYNTNKNKIKPLINIAKASVALHAWSIIRIVTVSIAAFMLEKLSEKNHSLFENIIKVYPSKIMCYIMINI